MTALRTNLIFAACLAAAGALHTAPVQAQATRDNIRMIEQEYARQTGGRTISDAQLEYYLSQRASGWSMAQVSADITSSRRTYSSATWRPAGGYVAREVICTSIGGRYRECAAPWRGNAMLSQQLSSTACVEGRSWGQKPGAIWVNNGCRAVFTVVRDTTARNNGMITCASNQGRYRECATGTRTSVTLVNRLNNSAACIEGRTWGNKRGAVWVDDGCRAQFSTRRYGGSASSGAWVRDPNYAVTCTSLDGRRTACDWDRRYGEPVLIQQISTGGCLEGRDWGYDANGGLWVNSGCRARFGFH